MNIDINAVIDELQKGWRKGDYGDVGGGGPVCLRGACARVAGLTHSDDLGDFGETQVDPIFAEPIREHVPERVEIAAFSKSGVPWVPAFNDHPDTTLDDVILVCEKARPPLSNTHHH
jgi:hypothetical protein